MEDLPPEVHTLDLYIGGRFARRMSREVFEDELDVSRAVAEALEAASPAFEEYIVDLGAALPPQSLPSAALHYRREGCTANAVIPPKPSSTNALLIEATQNVVTNFQPVVDSLADIARTIGQAYEQVLRAAQEQWP